MSDSSYKYTATSRIPVRPLSYENRGLALPKELIVDYDTGVIYICDLNGKISDITEKILEYITDEMVSNILDNDDSKEIIRNIDITLESGNTVTIEGGIIQLFADISSINNKLNTIPSASTQTPKASTEKGSIGTQKKVFALADHEHPKGLATVADSANSVEWKNVKNPPNFSSSDHNHDSVYYKKSGGDVSGEIGLLNTKGLYGYTTANAKSYIAYIGDDNRIHIGYNNNIPIVLDASIVLNSSNYGEDAPSDSEGVEGQLYIQLG